MWGRKRTNSKIHKRIRAVQEKSRQFKIQDQEIINGFSEKHPNKAQISKRLIKEGFMLYDKTKVTYFDVGEKKFEALYRDMENAKKFIFWSIISLKTDKYGSALKRCRKKGSGGRGSQAAL